MPKISDILQKYNIERETLAKSYKTVIGKALNAKAVNIKEEEWAQIEPTFALAHIGKPQKKDESKVFKAEEVSFGDDFLSGLGFAPVKAEEEDTSESEDIFNKETSVVAPIVEDVVKKQSFGNARVISSAPPRPPRRPN